MFLKWKVPSCTWLRQGESSSPIECWNPCNSDIGYGDTSRICMSADIYWAHLLLSDSSWDGDQGGEENAIARDQRGGGIVIGAGLGLD